MAMAKPSSFEVTPYNGLVENTKPDFRNLYMRQIISGATANQSTVIDAHPITGLGYTAVNNWPIYDGVGAQAKVVARAQGMHMNAGNMYNSSVMVFEIERFKGSTLQIMGATIKGEGDWAIVGGTGHFEMARGVIRKMLLEKTADEEIQELTVDGFCRMKLPIPMKMGPWGGSKGSLREIPGNKPRHLESVSIRSGGAADSISFTYYDEHGKICNSGRWGGDGGHDNPTFTFGPSEFVKEISGSIYDEYLSTLKIVTNLGRTYGPFGVTGSNPTRFSFIVPDDKTVVGFYARSDMYLNAIGIYTV